MSTRTVHRRAPRWLPIVGPALLVAIVFGTLLADRFNTYGGNVTGFVLFGSELAEATTAPPNAVVLSPLGYDGQYFYLQATDPLLLDDDTIRQVERTDLGADAPQAFRLPRMAYPALAYVLVAGQEGALAWGLLLLNLIVVIGTTLAFAVFCRRRGWSGWWALVIGLSAGFLTGTLRDLCDPLAAAAALGGIALWSSRRYGGAAALLTLAVLTRETMLAVVAAVAIEVALLWWRGRRRPSEPAERALRPGLVVVAVPVVAFAAWHAYCQWRWGGALVGAGLTTPLVGIQHMVQDALDNPLWRDRTWELTYLSLMITAGGLSLVAAWRRPTAPALAAALCAIVLCDIEFGDMWSYTRLSLPMFALLLLTGLEQRRRAPLLVCGGAALLTIAAPFTAWFAAS